MMIRAIFLNACPNCGGEIADDRLLHSLPCRRCLPEDKARELLKAYAELTPLAFKLKVRNALRELGSLKDYEDTIKLDLELKFTLLSGFGDEGSWNRWSRYEQVWERC